MGLFSCSLKIQFYLFLGLRPSLLAYVGEILLVRTTGMRLFELKCVTERSKKEK